MYLSGRVQLNAKGDTGNFVKVVNGKAQKSLTGC